MDKKQTSPEYLSVRQVKSEYPFLLPGSLANLRFRKQGPKYYKLNAKVLYKRADLEAWFSARPVLTRDSMPERAENGGRIEENMNAPLWYADKGGCQHGGWKFSVKMPWVLQCTDCGDQFYIMRIPVIRKLRRLLESLIAGKEGEKNPPEEPLVVQ